MRSLNRVCVFCGSRQGTDPAFIRDAQAMGRLLAESGIGLVYGGGAIGLMGVIADAALDAGGEVIGVLPEFMVKMEVRHSRLTELLIVASMHERKAKMAELSDAFVALPGGLGTLEELFEVLTWSQLRLHSKPIAVVSTNGFYRSLEALLDDATNADFIVPEQRRLISVVSSPGEALEALYNDQSRYEPPRGDLAQS